MKIFDIAVYGNPESGLSSGQQVIGKRTVFYIFCLDYNNRPETGKFHACLFE